mmetsp:Transcript_9585/g.31494  ORF Transcript_9585/g.31494 Transcript_9585/m.31494 type:complete len:365 (-) Transcript_9585:6-1100(-)
MARQDRRAELDDAEAEEDAVGDPRGVDADGLEREEEVVEDRVAAAQLLRDGRADAHEQDALHRGLERAALRQQPHDGRVLRGRDPLLLGDVLERAVHGAAREAQPREHGPRFVDAPVDREPPRRLGDDEGHGEEERDRRQRAAADDDAPRPRPRRKNNLDDEPRGEAQDLAARDGDLAPGHEVAPVPLGRDLRDVDRVDAEAEAHGDADDADADHEHVVAEAHGLHERPGDEEHARDLEGLEAPDGLAHDAREHRAQNRRGADRRLVHLELERVEVVRVLDERRRRGHGADLEAQGHGVQAGEARQEPHAGRDERVVLAGRLRVQGVHVVAVLFAEERLALQGLLSVARRRTTTPMVSKPRNRQ